VLSAKSPLWCYRGGRDDETVAERADILVVDDDPHLREVLRYALGQAGWGVREATNGQEALEQVKRAPPTLMILDLMMPELDGFEVCRQVRKTSQLPILFLSSRDDEVDRILGLELGGDDYVTKPFSPRELVARVKAVLRRLIPFSPDATVAEKTLQRGPLKLDLEQWRAFWNDQEVVLTVTELNLLKALVRSPGKAFSREELMAKAWDDAVVSDRTIDSHVRRIRQKFTAVGGEVIETVHGLGYRLALP
jgi:two-component system, OmpR family, response regulator